MKIEILTGDASLDWLNTRSRKEREEIQERINEAKALNAYLFTFISVEKIGKKCTFAILAFNADPVYDLVIFYHEAPDTRRGRAEMESSFVKLHAAMEGEAQ